MITIQIDQKMWRIENDRQMLNSDVGLYIWNCVKSVVIGETGDIKRIVHKNTILAGQTVNFAYYNILRLRENLQRLRPELWQQKNWLLHHDNAQSHTSSSRGCF
jgi:hypothetical protein